MLKTMLSRREYLRKVIIQQRKREAIIEETRKLVEAEQYEDAARAVYNLRFVGGPLRSYEWVQVQEIVEGADQWRF